MFITGSDNSNFSKEYPKSCCQQTAELLIAPFRWAIGTWKGDETLGLCAQIGLLVIGAVTALFALLGYLFKAISEICCEELPSLLPEPRPIDYYAILGVNKNATGEEIKAAYRRIAKQCHPDKNPDPASKEKFQQIAEAYAVLSNPNKRAQYDGAGFNLNREDPWFQEQMQEINEEMQRCSENLDLIDMLREEYEQKINPNSEQYDARLAALDREIEILEAKKNQATPEEKLDIGSEILIKKSKRCQITQELAEILFQRTQEISEKNRQISAAANDRLNSLTDVALESIRRARV
jgi:curved DNA-binding protein CbpA